MFRRSQSGFSLLEVLLAVSIAIGIGSMHLGQIRRDTENIQTRAVGEQLRMVGNALNHYIVLNYGNLGAMSSVAAPGTADDPGPRSCDAGTGICTITSDTLLRMGLVPSSFSGRNAFGATYEYYIRVQGSDPNYRIDGIVVTNQPYNLGGQPRFDLIGQALLVAGADSGTTRSSPTRVDGFNGAWAEDNYPINQLGLLAYRAGYGTSDYSSYLRLDGSTPMRGDLNMQNPNGTRNNIVGVANMEATGEVQAGQFVTEEPGPGIVLGRNSGANRTEIVNNNNEIHIRNNGGTRFLRHDNTAANITAGEADFDGHLTGRTASFTSNVAVDGNLTANQNLTVVGNITTNTGYIQTTSGNFQTTSGSFTTANGNVRAEGGTVSAQGLTISGNSALIGQNLTFRDGASTTSSWFYTASGNLMQLTNNTNLRIGGNLNVDGTATVGGVIQGTGGLRLGNVVNIGAGCNGTTGAGYARASNGSLLQCIGGIWTRTGAIENTTTIYGTASSRGGTSVATCPAGYRVVGGGYRLAAASLGAAPNASYGDPAGNRWVVEGNPETNQIQATAMCAQ